MRMVVILSISVNSISDSNILKTGVDLGVIGKKSIVYNCKRLRLLQVGLELL